YVQHLPGFWRLSALHQGLTLWNPLADEDLSRMPVTKRSCHPLLPYHISCWRRLVSWANKVPFLSLICCVCLSFQTSFSQSCRMCSSFLLYILFASSTYSARKNA
ncbi:MAG: hypothetical protein ACK5CO_05305, partial [Bacteroidota bacterium]